MRRRHKQGVLQTNGIRSMWEFVFVSQFLRVFQGKFGFFSFTAEELENAFLESESSALFGIFTELLRILRPKRDIKTTTWQDVFKEELANRTSKWNPFQEGKRYEAFSPEERVLLLKKLIDYLADGKDEELKEFVKDFLNPNSSFQARYNQIVPPAYTQHAIPRVKPIGRDASNNIYWYFDDLRLYREVLGKKGRRTGWETVCLNCHDWDKLLSTFQKSSNSNEKKLYKYLKNELYPAVMPSVKEDEKEKELETVKKERSFKAHHKAASKHKTDRNAVVRKEEEKEEKTKHNKLEEAEDQKIAQLEQEEDTVEEDQEQEEISEADEDFDPEDEEDSPLPRKKGRHPSSTQQAGSRKRGRPAGSSEGATDPQKTMEKIERRRKRSEQELEQMEKDIQERKKLEQRVEEEIQKQESIISAAGVDSRTKRRCVIMREQMSKKKEWWEEEGLGSESEEDTERDLDSDGSDGPRRRKKLKYPKSVEMPEPPNRIYVFSTGLANRAAEAVQMGRVESITAFHRAQPSSSPFLKVEQPNVFGKQKPYNPQQYLMRGSVGPMGQMSGYSGMSGGMHLSDRQSNTRPGYGTSQWDQIQAQQSVYKDRQRQTQSQAMDDIHQLLFGSSHSGNSQGASGVNGMYSRSGYNQQGAAGGEQPGSYTGYPRSGAPQQQGPYMERRTQDIRGQAAQQSHFPAFTQQPGQQQQGYFQRPRHLGGHTSQGNSNSPSSDPLGAGVRSPPPPYTTGRPPDSRHTRNSPVPSPTSTGSPHTPQTPLTPQTPRFPGPSPNEPSKPPFSPSHPQGSMSGPTMANYPVQGAPPGQPVVQADERPITSQPRPGFIELSSKTLSHGMQNPYSSVLSNYNQAQSPLDGRRLEENTSPAFGAHSNHESPLHSPTDHAPPSHYSSVPPNKSPFMRQVGQPTHNHSPFATSSSTVQGSKSFSVESLTAPSVPPLDKSSIPPSQLSEQPMPQYSGLYFPSNKYPPMFGQPQYQYPSHMQHPGAFYNSQLTPNMYLGRASLPVYPPTKDSGL